MTNRQSWEDFKREVFHHETVEIAGVEVPVPVDMPLGYEERAAALGDLGEDGRLEDFATLVEPLFGPDAFGQWVEAGMGQVELLTAITWGMAKASGRDISFSDAYAIVTSDDPGKALGQNRAARRAASKPRSVSTGGPSKRTSSGSTGSTRRRSAA
ncbi:hypothetical protein [Streptomyces sp. DH12]|uniref:hypothetical protein n=1 Tax=Streptomyces sp. DH12 TaxID=2857010 RepID=UPI001E413C9D|nr:hypothetical protein [Streptomyces sp. DH12]